jgi:two-component system cell cycle sensor histidine kinase PleC
VKFTPEYGRIAIRTRAVGGGLNIYVEDNGMGITPQAMARLGRPFEQMDHSLANGMKGSGLGLAIARSLIALHGGSMRIRSSLGKGTIVLVRLPNQNDLSQQKRRSTPPIAWHKLPLPALIDAQKQRAPAKAANCA